MRPLVLAKGSCIFYIITFNYAQIGVEVRMGSSLKQSRFGGVGKRVFSLYKHKMRMVALGSRKKLGDR